MSNDLERDFDHPTTKSFCGCAIPIIFLGRAKGELAQTITRNAEEQATKCRQWLTKQLGDQEWFNGDRFGWGDLSVVPHIRLSIGIGILLEVGSPLANRFKRVKARPSVAQTVQEANDSFVD